MGRLYSVTTPGSGGNQTGLHRVSIGFLGRLFQMNQLLVQIQLYLPGSPGCVGRKIPWSA